MKTAFVIALQTLATIAAFVLLTTRNAEAHMPGWPAMKVDTQFSGLVNLQLTGLTTCQARSRRSNSSPIRLKAPSLR